MKDADIRNQSTELLFKCVLTLKTVEDCYNFFEDLCTMQELESISQRVMVAKALSEKLVYNDIVEKTGASTATISRVKRSYQYGNGGYDKAFRNLKDNEL